MLHPKDTHVLDPQRALMPELQRMSWLQAMRMLPPPVRDELIMAMNVDFTLIDARDEDQLSFTGNLRVCSCQPISASLNTGQLGLPPSLQDIHNRAGLQSQLPGEGVLQS